MRGNVKQKGTLALAWISFIFAAVGGAALTVTFVGSWLSALVGLFPGWVAVAALAGAVVAMGVDLFVDGEPNRVALYTVMVIPTLARSVPGKLSATVVQLSHNVLGRANGALGSWLGTTSSLALGVTAVAVSLLIARRVVAKAR